MDDKKVRLLNSEADKHEEFSAVQAARLLKYPGSVYREPKAEVKAAEPKAEAPKATAKPQS